MTNWNLKSVLNRQKYSNSVISNSLNEFLSEDYRVTIPAFIKERKNFAKNESKKAEEKNNILDKIIKLTIIIQQH